MNTNHANPQIGLYDERFEHDACGIGLVANIKGVKSNKLVIRSLEALKNMTHRGGKGAELDVGDGAGILTQIPHKLFKKESKKAGFSIPKSGCYGVGMVFIKNNTKFEKCKEIIEKIIIEEGEKVIGWRDVPVNPDALGNTGRMNMPDIKQIFVENILNPKDQIGFERNLYIIRKRIESIAEKNELGIYFPSFSSRTVVYKGMLTALQLKEFYKDLVDIDYESAISLIHSRYSTNTFPSWERAHPNRYLVHNGEINTLRGNINWMKARQSVIETDVFGKDVSKVFPIIDEKGSDSSMFDNCLEFLHLSGYSLHHAVMMMIPEPWQNHESMNPLKKDFYKYHSCLMEPWDGPAAMAFSDGSVVGAVLDRNGLRPSRYYVTSDDEIILASEVGVIDIPVEKIVRKERLHPGRMLLIDTVKGKIISDNEIKEKTAKAKPYSNWIKNNLLTLKEIHDDKKFNEKHVEDLNICHKVFGYTYEDLKSIILPMARDGVEAIGSMGNDSPLAVLSENPQLLYNYFKQLFAQVTNPPIDSIREDIVTGTEVLLGSEGNIINPDEKNCKRIMLKHPILDNREINKLKNLKIHGFKSKTFSILFNASQNGEGLKNALEKLFEEVGKAIENGTNIIILSDKNHDEKLIPIPALLAVAGLHHQLIRTGKRTKTSIVIESGEPREVHHFALLVGYGASAINPYIAFESVDYMLREGIFDELEANSAQKNYIKASAKGIKKILSKMGISTIQSYQGAQIFEALGLGEELIKEYFAGTPSRIGGIGLEEVAKEAILRNENAFGSKKDDALDSGGFYQWRTNGEYHLFNPETIYKLQMACRQNNYDGFKEYSKMLKDFKNKPCTLRSFLEFKSSKNSVPLEEVESVESICKRFKTGAMSYGSISKEAHECLAKAMNTIGGKSNSGEGGEDPSRLYNKKDGVSVRSAIKQIASGRFGVTSEYLVNADELQIKMAQGAKPGEGGQLPGRKVYPWIAKTRHSTPGVGLISPPPHHDIYSIEDLAQLIHDLKNANSRARINVKLVSEVGVGTVAAGVAKGRADVILISGYDGGTGASPRTSIRHAGIPWEIGLSETHQTLLLNKLRNRVTLETDGKLMTGRDVVIAALLGAEEYGFATTPLVAMGCVMMRVCNLDTCPVGIATQNPLLRKNFCGKPEYVINLLKFIAQEMREIMSELGFRTVDEMIGRTDKIKITGLDRVWKAKKLDFSRILFRPEMPVDVHSYCCEKQNHELEKSLDKKVILNVCKQGINEGKQINAIIPVNNTNRAVCTMLGSEISRKFRAEGLPEDTIILNFKGSAGQSFGAFVPKGVTMILEGDSNDYIGKGLSGGKIVVYPPKESVFKAEKNIIIGNTSFYGATSGEAYIRGIAGERFCVRNSGLKVVVEGVGDHACEYMTGGTVVIIGSAGRNFAAGMSGGTAFVFDKDMSFKKVCNMELVGIEKLSEKADILTVKKMLEKHLKYTGSESAKKILQSWNESKNYFIKVIPEDYKRMISTISKNKNKGLEPEQASMEAFKENNRSLARVSGN